MRFFITLLFVTCSVFTLSAQNGQNKIPYYNADSILPYMPLHKAHQDSLKQWKTIADQQTAEMQAERETQKKILKDSANLSPLIKAMRKEQLKQMESNIIQYDSGAQKDFHVLDSTFRVQEIAEIQKSADVVAKQKGYSKITEKAEAVLIQRSKPTGWYPEDVTELVMKEMKLR